MQVGIDHLGAVLEDILERRRGIAALRCIDIRRRQMDENAQRPAAVELARPYAEKFH